MKLYKLSNVIDALRPMSVFFCLALSNNTLAMNETSEQNALHQEELYEQGWRQVWSDEFYGNSIKEKKWSYEQNCWGGGNNEQQCYTDRPENSYVKDGLLHITAKEESFSGPAIGDDDPSYDPNDTSKTLPFTSARLRSKNKFDFRYGRVEVRAKAPQGQGTWPAIWMLPTDNEYGGWPQSGEIDIMEVVNLGVWPNEVHGTLHYGLQWPQWENHGATIETDYNPADDFHVYAIEWEADEIRWYLDGEHYQTQTSDGWYNYIWKDQKRGLQPANKRAPFNRQFHLIMNFAVGGDWPGSPDTNWPEDRELLVDYVRVYKCFDQQTGKKSKEGTGCATIVPSVEVNTDAGKPQRNNFLLYGNRFNTIFTSESNGAVKRHRAQLGYWELNPDTVFANQVNIGAPRGNVHEVLFNGLGNIFLTAPDMSDVPEYDNGVELFGGTGWSNNGEIEFKMRVISASDDSKFIVKLDSGWPNLGEKEIDIPELGKWTNVKVRVSDLIANPNPAGGGVDLSNIQNLFVLEYAGTSAQVQIDTIKLQCAVNSEPEVWQGDQTCSINPRAANLLPAGDVIDIYSDAFTEWPILDCCGGASISEINDNGNNVVEVTYDNDAATNTVTFFQSASPFDLSEFAGGTLEFDLFVISAPSNPAADPWIVKVDCVFPCGTGDVPITESVEGQLPVVGVWQHFTFNIDDMVSRGLDLTSVDTPLVIFPAWGNQDGAAFRIDNIRWSKAN